MWKWGVGFQKEYQQDPAVYAAVPIAQSFDIKLLKNGHWPIYLGKMNDDGTLTVSESNYVLGENPQMWTLIPGVHFEPAELIDITNEFWSTYQAIGRCLFHDHNVSYIKDGSKDRYKYNENKTARICQWCGHKQTSVWI